MKSLAPSSFSTSPACTNPQKPEPFLRGIPTAFSVTLPSRFTFLLKCRKHAGTLSRHFVKWLVSWSTFHAWKETHWKQKSLKLETHSPVDRNYNKFCFRQIFFFLQRHLCHEFKIRPCVREFSICSRSLETITRHLPLTKKVFGAAHGYRLFIPGLTRLDGHDCYMYAGTSKYRSAPHKLSKLRV